MEKILHKNKRGQVTIFIILALAVVALGILIYMFYPQISSTLGFTVQNPNAFMQECVSYSVKDIATNLSSQGGSINPEFYFLYKGQKLEYLCYTNEYYKTCVMQQPLLKTHIENEIKGEITQIVKDCFVDMKESYEKKGYTVSMTSGAINVELLPEKIVVSSENALTLTKEDSEQYGSFKMVTDNNLYELIGIANSILSYEATYGDSEITTYMDYYHNLKVEKYKQEDGTKVYILTDRDTSDKFQFATRSLAWPPGVTNE